MTTFETDVATELPRPIVFKMEFPKFNTKNPQSYKIRSLQPLVRIKRINWNSEVIQCGQTHSLQSGTLNFTRLSKHLHPSLANSSTAKNLEQRIIIQNAYSLNSSSTNASPTPSPSPCDSGVSSALYDHRPNAKILMEIAAERAFINHHLTHFGYSPIQFDLYNDLSDMSIFLKYLLGQVVTRQK